MKDRAIELARQAGLHKPIPFVYESAYADKLHRFYQLVRNEALEEAAKYCEDQSVPYDNQLQTDGQWAALALAVQIRNRKEPS